MMKMNVSAERLADGLDELVDRRGVLAEAAAAVEANFQRHLRESYASKDVGGVTYWADVAASVTHEVRDGEAVVRASGPGLRLRLEGGMVTPGKGISSHTGRPTRALAIPSDAVPVRDGRRVAPAQAGPLAFIAARGGEVVGYLIQGETAGKISRGPNKGKPRVKPGGPLLYTLKMRQAIRGDAGILPEVLLGGEG